MGRGKMPDLKNETPREAAGRLTEFLQREGFKPQAMYAYKDKDGETQFLRIRLAKPSGEKRIYPLSRNGKGWQLKEPDFPSGKKLLYKLPEIIKNPEAITWIVEGENKVNALSELGIIATTSGGTTSAAKADWTLLKGRNVVIWPDNDTPGAKYADEVTEILLNLDCRIERIDVPKLGLPEKGDVIDFLQDNPEAAKEDIENLPRVKMQIESDTTPAEGSAAPSKDETYLTNLAMLPRIEYDRVRGEAAKKIGIRAATLDIEVENRRPASESNNTTSGSAVLFEEPEPWAEPVEGVALINDIVDMIKRYVALPEGAAETIALWILHTYTLEAAFISPILAITSPQKRCGKTTLLTILNSLVCKPLPASNVSPAALFRAVEKWKPTLLIDEADSFLKNSDELRGILNSGHSRPTAYVMRTTGENHEVVKFSTWGAKAIALIGKLPDTLEDRALVVSMRRKRPDETVKKLRADQLDGFHDMARKCSRWAGDNLDTLESVDSEIPTFLHDRAADNWSALLGIADTLGGTWPEQARKAAATISGGAVEETAKIQLLGDIQDLYQELDTDRLPSELIVERLVKMESRDWPEWKNGKPITKIQLARQLKPFGIIPTQWRDGDETHRGYQQKDLADSFDRYLRDETGPQVGTVGTPLNIDDLQQNQVGTGLDRVPTENYNNPPKNNDVPIVPTQQAVLPGGMEDTKPQSREALEL